jgi:hypothetical protein
MNRRMIHWLAGALVSAIAAPVLTPQLLAAPYKERVGTHVVRSVDPITPAVRAAVVEADRRVESSPSGAYRAPDQSIFLTAGGWRWLWLAGTAQGGFAVTRAINDAIIVNRTDGAKALVHNGAAVGGQRLLAGVIAHEMTHGSLRAHFGVTVDFVYPAELREGYCDYVAQESSLGDAEALALRRQGQFHPALIYWSGRKRVAEEMARPGAGVERLFAEWKSRSGTSPS